MNKLLCLFKPHTFEIGCYARSELERISLKNDNNLQEFKVFFCLLLLLSISCGRVLITLICVQGSKDNIYENTQTLVAHLSVCLTLPETDVVGLIGTRLTHYLVISTKKKNSAEKNANSIFPKPFVLNVLLVLLILLFFCECVS
jgi:hypothetical protein